MNRGIFPTQIFKKTHPARETNGRQFRLFSLKKGEIQAHSASISNGSIVYVDTNSTSSVEQLLSGSFKANLMTVDEFGYVGLHRWLDSLTENYIEVDPSSKGKKKKYTPVLILVGRPFIA